MALPAFSGFSLQDDNFISSVVEDRVWPTRAMDTLQISRRPGVKLTSTEFGERRIKIQGSIVGTDSADLQSKIDDLNVVLQKKAQILQTRPGRAYTASAVSIALGDPTYSQSYTPFDLEFLCADPFAYGSQVSATMTVASGTISQSFSTTISGSYYAEPVFSFLAIGSTGVTTTSGVTLTNVFTGEYVTWSGIGGNPYLNYGDTLSFDFKSYKVLQNSNQVSSDGVYARWEPGVANLQLTFGGNVQGGTITVSYTPRYL